MATDGASTLHDDRRGTVTSQRLSEKSPSKRTGGRLRAGGNDKKHPKKKGYQLGDKVKSALQLYSTASTMIHRDISQFIVDHQQLDIDSWTWESYTPEESIKEIKQSKKGKGKGKDNKAADVRVAAETVDGAKPKRMNKQEKQEFLSQMAEKSRLQQELEAKAAEEEQRLLEIQERKAGMAKEKKEKSEQALRTEQLHSSLQTIAGIVQRNSEVSWQERDQIEWNQYLKCDGLPDPYVCGQMNNYLQLWDEVIEKTTMEEACSRSKEALKLLDDVTSFIDCPLGAGQRQIENWKWIRRLFREYQQKSLDVASYRILRDISNKMQTTKLIKADYHIIDGSFTVCLSTMLEVPKSLPNPRAPARPRVEIYFPELEMNVLLPANVDCYLLALRTMYVKYDHLSDLCATYTQPPVPAQYTEDIYKAILNEWNSKLIYKYEQYRIIKNAEGEKVPEQDYDVEAGILPKVPYVKIPISPSTHVISEEDDTYGKIRDRLITTVNAHVINLRKYVVIGGTYSINLYYQPSQPQLLVSIDFSITRLLVPKCLKEVRFRVVYKPPPPHSPSEIRTPEDVEVENKKQEAELDRLVFVSLKLPDHVMWLDTPLVCQWIKDKNVWSTVDVHDFKYLEESASVTFRTATFGQFAFAVNRYTNLPYQTWELKPETNGTVTLQLTAAILVIDFNILNNNICILHLQNSPNNALREIIGKYFKLAKLKRILLDAGVDVFPWFDAFCYVENSCEKHWPMEKHLYFQMAQLSSCYNFAWSRWNMIAGRRSVIMQMREYKPERAKQLPHSMLHVTPLKAELITCTEVSSSFLPEPVEGMPLYSDLYTLFKGTCAMITRTKVQNASPLLVGTVAELLQATRILSFSS